MVLSAENMCYVRFILLLLKEGKGVLAKIVSKGLEKEGLSISEFLHKNEEQIRKSGSINLEQIELLYPPSGEVSDISIWDITLLSHFARKFFTKDNSLDRVTVDYIKEFRNKYFHSGNATADENDFEELSKLITSSSHSQERLEEINDSIQSIKSLELYPALEQLKMVDPKLCESIEGRLGIIEGQLVRIERTVQQLNEDAKRDRQEVLELKENIRRDAERFGEAKIAVPNVHGIVHVHLRSESTEALADVLNAFISSSRNVLENTRTGSKLEEKVKNVFQDISNIGGEVIDVQQGSVAYIIKCSSLTYLMYLIDYFYSPRMRFRLEDIEKALEHSVWLTADVQSRTLKDMQVQMKGGDTQQNQGESTAVENKVKAFLDKLEKEKLQDYPQTGQEQSTDPSQQPGPTSRKRKINNTESQELIARMDNNAKRCGIIITKMQDMFNSNPDKRQQYPCVRAWLKVLEDIEKKLELKATVIAVLGNTGEGKSSLMNAILDHGDVLPTSGRKACTATVVEVVESKTKFFEAEIEFLEEKEWFSELENLCKDLTDENGVIIKSVSQINPNGSIYDAYCKITAVYGEIDSFDVLSTKTNSTQWLGKKKPIKEENLNALRHAVDAYIEVPEPGKGQSFWPIVKIVRLKLPDCDVCSSGAVLVDLPGQGDTDATRNRIASSYTENCDAIWVVSSIHRAVNDRTAQNLLGEHFRRQLYMDGQFGAVSFICTKTDMIHIKESRRENKELIDRTEELFQQRSKLDSQKEVVSEEVKAVKKAIHKQTQFVQRENEDRDKKQQTLKDLECLFKEENFEKVNAETSSQLTWKKEELQEELKTKEENIKAEEKGLNNMREKLERMENELKGIEDEINTTTKTLKEMCAKDRNSKCMAQIKDDFESGYKDIETASLVKGINKEDRKELPTIKPAENLKVFCCSSTDYQYLTHPDPGDTPAAFSKPDDTNIPQLRSYVHELVGEKRKLSLSIVLSSMEGLIFEIQSYLSDKQDMKTQDQEFMKLQIVSELAKLQLSIDSMLENFKCKLAEIFDRHLIVKLREGAENAVEKAISTCAGWGKKYSRDNRIEGGLHHKTYQAVVRRNGIHKEVDFNRDLAQPILKIIAVEWNNVFSLFSVVEGLISTVLQELRDRFLQERRQCLDQVLDKFGIGNETSENDRENQYMSATNKIDRVVNELQWMIFENQHKISRQITPHLQSCLVEVYRECAMITGDGMLEKIKSKMATGIDQMSSTMFEQAVDNMETALQSLKEEILTKFKENIKEQVEDLKGFLVTYWKDNTILRSAFGEDVEQFSTKVKKMKKDFQSLEVGPSKQKRKRDHSQLE